MAGATQASYQYVKLSEAKARTTGKPFNVFGVVTFSKVPHKTRGTDYCLTLSIADESLPHGDKIVCSLFYRQLDSFPAVCVGDVVRFHRLVLEDFHGEPKGKPGPGFSWLVVGDDVDRPCASSASFTYTDDNKKRVDELKAWARQQGLVRNSYLATFATLTPHAYCDVVCQVIGTVVEEEGVCFVARVWDGTRPLHATVNTSNSLQEVDRDLEQTASDMAVDIWLYDDHFQTHQRMQAGQYVKLCNLHAYVQKESGNPAGDIVFPTLELTIHRGTSFGRGVVFLDPNLPEAVALKKQLTSVPLSATAASSSNLRDQHQRDRKQLCPTAAESSEAFSISSRDNHSTSQGSSVQECMLQTATVIVGHQHISRTTLSNVLSHSVPYKFRVLVSLVDFYPNTDEASQFVQLMCPQCFQLKTRGERDENTAVTDSQASASLTSRLAGFLGGGFANWNPKHIGKDAEADSCPDCSTAEGGLVYLEPTYMLRLVLKDSTGHLVANLWRKEAVTFFGGVSADAVLKDKDVFINILSNLRRLCLSSTVPPKLDCCLFSYSTQSGVSFHIFDTELV